MSNDTLQEDAAIRLEERPTGDFVDGYLAGLATLNAALAGAPAHSFFYSFNWIGDDSETIEASLLGAFHSDAAHMAFDIEKAPDWREAVHEIAGRWLGRQLDPNAGAAVASEFVEIMSAFIGAGPATVHRVRPTAPAGRGDFEPRIGSSFEHLLFETIDGRLLLEFSIDF